MSNLNCSNAVVRGELVPKLRLKFGYVGVFFLGGGNPEPRPLLSFLFFLRINLVTE